jgi:hypothetical protein
MRRWPTSLNVDFALWTNPYPGNGKAGVSNSLYSACNILWAKSPIAFGHWFSNKKPRDKQG